MEQKYFISYIAYNDNEYVILNDIIYINEEITSELLEQIQESLINRLNKEELQYPYNQAQIINLVKI